MKDPRMMSKSAKIYYAIIFRHIQFSLVCSIYSFSYGKVMLKSMIHRELPGMLESGQPTRAGRFMGNEVLGRRSSHYLFSFNSMYIIFWFMSSSAAVIHMSFILSYAAWSILPRCFFFLSISYSFLFCFKSESAAIILSYLSSADKSDLGSFVFFLSIPYSLLFV